jgi:Tol biopolymer transport system component
MALYFNRDGRLLRLALAEAARPETIDTGALTRCNNDHGISPDGTQLVVSDLTETGKSLMYLLPIGGGSPRRIEVGAPAYWHGWSPDGKTLAYCAARDGEYEIYTIPVAGGAETRLTTRKGNDNGPDYSPDGRWIYFHAIDGDSVQVWRMRPDGSQPEQVTRDEYYNWYPHPSPDGKWIAVFSTKTKPETGHPPDGDYVLRLLPTSGGAPREAARFYGGNGSINVPCWSRDSARLAYAVFEPER